MSNSIGIVLTWTLSMIMWGWCLLHSWLMSSCFVSGVRSLNSAFLCCSWSMTMSCWGWWMSCMVMVMIWSMVCRFRSLLASMMGVTARFQLTTPSAIAGIFAVIAWTRLLLLLLLLRLRWHDYVSLTCVWDWMVWLIRKCPEKLLSQMWIVSNKTFLFNLVTR